MNVNPLLWFGEREVKLTPPHFTKCPTYLTEKSRHWVLTKTQGRYSICQGIENEEDFQAFIFEDRHYVYFEDPVEATLYELRWSGSK